jgi:hypothetical protein
MCTCSHHLEFPSTVSPRDSQGLPNPIENFNVRFEDFNNLGAKDHRAAFKVIDDYVKSCTTGVMDQELKGIVKASDIGDSYLESKMNSSLLHIRRRLCRV